MRFFEPLEKEFRQAFQRSNVNKVRLAVYLATVLRAKFDVGEHSNFALMPMAVAAMEQILAWDIGEICMTLRGKTGHILRKLDLETVSLLPEPCRAPHILGLRFKAGIPQELAAVLREKNVHVSIRGNSMRVSPHLYNTDEELERFILVLSEIIQ